MIANRLLDDAIDSILSGDMNQALALNRKMDALLNQLKVHSTLPAFTSRLWAEPTNLEQQPARTIAGGSYDVDQSSQPGLVDPSSGTSE